MKKSKSKKQKKVWWKRLLLWLSRPVRRGFQHWLHESITKDIALLEAELRLKKPHWSERLVKKRARKKFKDELRKINMT